MSDIFDIFRKDEVTVEQELQRDFSDLIGRDAYDHYIEEANKINKGNLKAFIDNHGDQALSPTDFTSNSADDFIKLALYIYALMWDGIMPCVLAKFNQIQGDFIDLGQLLSNDIEERLDDIQDRLDDLE